MSSEEEESDASMSDGDERRSEVCDLTDDASKPARATRRGDATLFFTAHALEQLQRDLARPRGDEAPPAKRRGDG